MVDRAESVRDPVVAAMTNEQQVTVAERLSTVGAFAQGVEAGRLDGLPHFPVRALHRPWHDVLEPAEHGTTVAGVLAEPVAVVLLDRIPAPGAGEPFSLRRVRACPSR
jgi:hypothetical protein